MIRSILVMYLLFLVGIAAMGQKSVLPQFPDSLLDGSKSVVISREVDIDILARDKYVTTYKSMVRVLDNRYDEANTVHIYYDKHIRPDQIEIIVRDSTMKKLKSYTKGDMTDHAHIDGLTFASDDRYLKWRCGAFTVPYHIEVSYRLQSDQTFIITPFYPLEDTREALVSAELRVKNHMKANRLYYNQNPWGIPSVDSTTESVVYRFGFRNMKAVGTNGKSNEFMTPVLPVLTEFSMDGMDGDMSTWAGFGNWLARLNRDQDKLNEKAVSEIRNLIAGETDQMTIIKKLYKYLQGSTRYVSIQLGIGGWKPLSAQYVHENKYGDCKALSIYMKALLKTAGIDSYYTVLRAGKNARSINENIVSNQFNHAILMVPVHQDTLFLECTSDHDPAGYLGSFTSNRKVLYINENTSGLTTSTRYSQTDNTISGKSIVTLDKQNPILQIEQKMTGICTDLNRYMDNRHLDDAALGRYLIENIWPDSKNLKVLRNSLVKDGKYPHYSISIHMSDPVRVTSNGSRYFVQMDLNKTIRTISDELRLKNVKNHVQYGYTITDTIAIMIPSACKIEKSPKTVELNNEAGSFRAFPVQAEGEFRFVYDLIIHENKPKEVKQAEELHAIILKALSDRTVVSCQVTP